MAWRALAAGMSRKAELIEIFALPCLELCREPESYGPLNGSLRFKHHDYNPPSQTHLTLAAAVTTRRIMVFFLFSFFPPRGFTAAAGGGGFFVSEKSLTVTM